AGIYQLTPLKDVCFSKCREPLDFIVTSWRGGATSALELGMLHGAYCRLLLASLCHPLSARHHECWSNGGCHSHYTRRENAALASAHALRYGRRACALWCAGDYVTSTAAYLPARCRRGYARKNANDDAREVAHPSSTSEAPMSPMAQSRHGRVH